MIPLDLLPLLLSDLSVNPAKITRNFNGDQVVAIGSRSSSAPFWRYPILILIPFISSKVVQHPYLVLLGQFDKHA